MKAFNINIVGLSNKPTRFDYEFGDDFFEHYATDSVSGSKFTAEVVVDKHETFLDVSFKIKGHVTLVCDRSLETFDEPLKSDKKIVFKYGDEEAELSDEIVVIPRDMPTLDIGKYLYKFIVLSLPMKRVHPKLRDEDNDDASEGKMVYTSTTEKPEDVIDPRWEQLKKLK